MSSDFLSKEVVYVNSTQRLSGTATNFSIDLSQQIRIPNDFDTCTLLNFNMPAGYYMITSTNNTFTVTENKTQTVITIPAGNYSFIELADELQTLLLACSYSYTCTANQNSALLSFAVTGNGGIQPIFTFTSASPYTALGFGIGTYTFSANSLTAPNLAFLQLTSTLLLCCDAVERNILSVIVPDNSSFQLITYIEPNPTFASHPLVKFNDATFNFYLLDGNTGLVIDNNGYNLSFTMALYKKNNYFRSMIEDKKLELLMKQKEIELAQNSSSSSLT